MNFEFDRGTMSASGNTVSWTDYNSRTSKVAVESRGLAYSPEAMHEFTKTCQAQAVGLAVDRIAFSVAGVMLYLDYFDNASVILRTFSGQVLEFNRHDPATFHRRLVALKSSFAPYNDVYRFLFGKDYVHKV